jgi:uncharacterized ubiquitin-like protein YukD
MAASGPDPFLTLIVRSTSGTFTERHNRQNRARKVFDDAIRYFSLNTGPGVTYVLRRETDGRLLALDEKLVDLGLADGDVLLLQTNQAQDG